MIKKKFFLSATYKRIQKFECISIFNLILLHELLQAETEQMEKKACRKKWIHVYITKIHHQRWIIQPHELFDWKQCQ